MFWYLNNIFRKIVAILEKKHRLLSDMLEAVYVDLLVSRSIVRIQPKATFFALFESLKNQVGNKITVFTAKPGNLPQRGTVLGRRGRVHLHPKHDILSNG
jgi:hypothetical protein